MNVSRTWLASAALVCFASLSQAAPVPVSPPQSQGPLSDALRLRGLLPRTAPLRVSKAVMPGEGVVELEVQVYVTVTERAIETVRTADGKAVQVERFVTRAVPQAKSVQTEAKFYKFYSVTAKGKLEAIDAAKEAALLKKKSPILTGDSADVDPRTLEIVKPGTICLIQLPMSPTKPPPPIPEERPRR